MWRHNYPSHFAESRREVARDRCLSAHRRQRFYDRHVPRPKKFKPFEHATRDVSPHILLQLVQGRKRCRIKPSRHLAPLDSRQKRMNVSRDWMDLNKTSTSLTRIQLSSTLERNALLIWQQLSTRTSSAPRQHPMHCISLLKVAGCQAT